MPILRSQHQAELLTMLLLHPGTEYSITELSEKLGVPLTTVQREVNRFLAVGLITEKTGRPDQGGLCQPEEPVRPVTHRVADSGIRAAHRNRGRVR